MSDRKIGDRSAFHKGSLVLFILLLELEGHKLNPVLVYNTQLVKSLITI